ncbi:DNA alkylation repair protein [Vibrio variabilis]|uniref:DNA alkylation repair protein n=1 Tax=Vibrio variabilis TaxID=990271 RepID=UPI000DD831C9|nr:DNA alkylation repair protein [Vibrio variabilis]
MTIVRSIEQELKKIGYPEQCVRTVDIRRISAKTFRSLDNKGISNVLALCEELLITRDWAYGVIAYDWAFRVKKQYTPETYVVFENWLLEYVNGWGDCDDFCTHAFGELLRQYNELSEKTLSWVKHDHFAVQRAAAVILIYPIKKDAYSGLNPYLVAKLLFKNEHQLVQKGYGWLLKELSKKEPQQVIEYLRDNHKVIPRTAFRYALGNLDRCTKDALMSL